ncbi:LacI family DNA-binding transcriptional regulator [Alkalicoccus saliphilus]|uniref:LacI family transcriptional regulator n=1 Tax=Alkalicoccus saliphilus TaxID=200989 RepID=A0A2T4U5B8_9BACI|nr:LacI family DNA-binding transcriptional regulator [Alkalicoccus saliphilus]PTL38598.1 LacI family transcriptional regulator [Alkalicoccus saliphilus]
MVTINDIARRAGVSRTTVSRFINESGYVSEKARENISRVIEATGYVPSEQAKSLRLKRTKVIGVVIPKISTETMSRVVNGMDEVLQQEGYQILLASSSLDKEKEIEQLKLLESRRVDGIILVATNREPELLEAVKNLSVPVVAVGQHLPDISSVVYNDYEAAKSLTKEILRAGHTKIGFIGVDEADYSVGVLRKKGFLDALKENGCSVESGWMQTASFSISAGEEAAARLLDQSKTLPTAVLAVTDRLAVGVMQTLRKEGFDLPGEMAVAGMGASDMSAYVTPALTTVDYYYEEAGKVSAGILLKAITGRAKKVEKSQMDYRLLKRDSLR